MKKLLLLPLTIIICAACFGQSRKIQDSSALQLPPLTILKFTPQEIQLFNSIIDGQDFSHKQWLEFVTSYNRQLTSQLIRVPIKKDSTNKK